MSKKVRKLTEQILNSKSRIPQMSELVSMIVSEFGGVQAVATAWMVAYKQATPGVQAKMMDNFVLNLRYIDEKTNKSNVIKNLDTDTLRELVEQLMEKRLGQTAKEVGGEAQGDIDKPT